MAKKKWIKKAISPENKGKFREKAEAAGKSTSAFASEHAGDSGTLGREARLAKTLMSMKHKGKGKSSGKPTVKGMMHKMHGTKSED